MDNYTIAEDFELPSKGLIYSSPIKYSGKMRSMTTEEEMKRLSKSDYPYKVLAEIIDDCILDKLGISSYDLYIGDFQYLLYKLRIITYGKDYHIESHCPVCGTINKECVDLEQLPILTCDDKFTNLLTITLPASKKSIKLNFQTPRMLDDIRAKILDFSKKSTTVDPTILFTLQAMINEVDGTKLAPIQLESFVRKLPMRDVNHILNNIDKIRIGIDSNLTCKCSKCGGEYAITFPITREFFRPAED